MTYSTFVLRIMEDRKKGMLCLNHLTLELEEEKKLTIMKKPRNDTKKLNQNLGALVHSL
jgi:predicted transcriptional regulator YheO